MAEIKIRPKSVGSGWNCPRCKARHTVGIYPSLHMREGLTHTCDCGAKGELRNWAIKYPEPTNA